MVEKIRSEERVEHLETLRQTKDGRLIDVSVTASPMRDGNGKITGISIIAHDITAQKEHEREFTRMNRLHVASSQINQIIVRTPDRDELFRKVCQILVEPGCFHMAWIGWHDPGTHLLVPMAVAGDEKGCIRNIKAYADDRPGGQGPTGMAFRAGVPYICNDMLKNPVAAPWGPELLRRGFQALAVFPIRMKNEVSGTLTVYSDEPCFFRDKEIALLTEAAGDVSFALDNLAEKEARREVGRMVKDERLFSDMMIESMPGILYFYDDQGRFLRWNRNFEIISGYTGAEIAGMNPLDFFAPEDQPLVKRRIEEVLEKGESFVEAPFRGRDGRTTPYFFTGRRVEFDGKACLVGMGLDISERKHAEEALTESEGKLQALFDQAPLGIAVIDSTSGQFRKINPQYCKIVGYQQSEMLALGYQAITHPDDLENDLEHMRRLQGGNLPAFHIEKRYIRKDGPVVWVRLTCVPLWGVPGTDRQHIAMVEDITERKLAGGRLEESERKYRELVELANSIILRWTPEGRITFLNEFGQRFFGYSAAEITGRNVMETIVPPTESEGRDLRQLMEQICADPGAFEQNVNENIRRSGERVFIAWTNRIVRDAEGRVVEILSVGTDITAQRKAEQEIRELNTGLERRVAERTADMHAALIRAEAADKLKSAFLATMSHELRTPLNSIVGFTGILLQGLAGPLTQEQTKQLGMVKGSARHLLELINDVLDLSKIEAGQLEVHPAPFDLRASLERVTASVRPLAERKGLVLDAVIPPEAGGMVSDRRRVEQILLNLLNNAIKFTDKGSVTLTVRIMKEPGPAPDASVRFEVADTGIGVKPEDLGTLFRPFHQIDSGLARQHEGTGLGLAICRRLAALLGGEIAATSQWARGSLFIVTLPLNRTAKS